MEMPVQYPGVARNIDQDPARENGILDNQGEQTMPGSLWDLRKGEECIVQGFNGGLEELYRVRLMELGFHPGEKVTCIQVPRLGAPRLFRVHNTIYALDDQIARQVLTGARQE